jgi:hypothetical protein
LEKWVIYNDEIWGQEAKFWVKMLVRLLDQNVFLPNPVDSGKFFAVLWGCQRGQSMIWTGKTRGLSHPTVTFVRTSSRHVETTFNCMPGSANQCWNTCTRLPLDVMFSRKGPPIDIVFPIKNLKTREGTIFLPFLLSCYAMVWNTNHQRTLSVVESLAHNFLASTWQDCSFLWTSYREIKGDISLGRSAFWDKPRMDFASVVGSVAFPSQFRIEHTVHHINP